LFSQHELPSLKCSEEDCLADFVLRKDARLNNTSSLWSESLLSIASHIDEDVKVVANL
jgi:hypothetical protein